nr:helix-turn-helix domain-containing protein [uncultured Roseibium sp.]
MSDIWFPPAEVLEGHEFVSNFELTDCHSELDLVFANVGSNYNFNQLSPGRFSGRVLKIHTGRVLIVVEKYNQVLETAGMLPGDCFTFGAAIPRRADIAWGADTASDTDQVMVAPPLAEGVGVLPPVFMCVGAQVQKDALLAHPALLPEVADWLCGLRGRPVSVTSSQLAARFREDTLAALETMVSSSKPECRKLVDDSFLLGLVVGFNFEWLRQNSYATFKPSRARKRFMQARQLLLSAQEDVAQTYRSSLKELGSPRIFEQAFSSQVQMGPLTYSRIVRLNNARRKLLNGHQAGASIGDIAAEEGFWDWSRFTTHYRRQFGELPSETRMRGEPPGC